MGQLGATFVNLWQFVAVTEYEKKIANGMYNPDIDGVLKFDWILKEITSKGSDLVNDLALYPPSHFDQCV